MKKRLLTRTFSMILVLTILCSLIVLPVSAVEKRTMMVTFTNEDGTALGSTIEKDTVLKARVISTAETLTLSGKLAIFLSENLKVKTFLNADDESVYAGSELTFSAESNVSTSNSGKEALKISLSASSEKKVSTTKALAYFYLTVQETMQTAELNSALTFANVNSKSTTEIDGVGQCSTYVENGSREVYECTWNACPYLEGIYNELGNDAYNTTTTVGDLRKKLSINAYDVEGKRITDWSDVHLYTDATCLEEVNYDKPLSYYLNTASGTGNVTGRFYVTFTADGVEMKGETTPVVKKDTIKSIEVAPKDASKGYTFVYTYQGAGAQGNGFTLAKDSYTVTATYMSDATGEIDGKKLSYAPAKAGATTITAECEGIGGIEITFPAIPKVEVESLPTARTTSYTGSEQTVSWADDTFNQDYYTVTTGDKQTNAGDHDVTLTLNDKDNVKWADSENETHTVNWTINKATGYLKVEQKGDIYTSTTIGDITDLSKNYLEATATSSLALPATGTISLTAQNGGDYLDGFKFPAGEHTLNYTFTPNADNENNYASVTGSLTLNVQERGVKSIAIVGTPKTQYKYGQSIDASSLDIQVTFTDNETRLLTAEEKKDVTIAPQPLEVGQTEVTVTYQGMSTKITDLEVTAWTIAADRVRIVLEKPNERIEYNGDAQTPGFYVEFESATDKYTRIPSDQYTVKYKDNTNAGTAKITITSVENANYAIKDNGTKSKTFEIQPAKVTINEVTIKQKTYDGSKTAEIDSVDFSGVYAKDSAVTVSSTGVTATFNSMDVKDANTVTLGNVSAFALTGTGSANYTVDTTSLNETITGVSILPREITLTQLGAKNKNYDTTDTAEVDQSKVTFNEEPRTCEGSGKDVLTVTATGKFSDANAGENKSVTFSNVALGGASRIRTNYKLIVTAPLTTTARIYQHNIEETGVQKNTTLLLHGTGEFADPTIDGVNNEKVTGTFTYSYDGKTSKTDISSALRTAGVKEGGYDVGFTFTPDANGNYSGTVTGTLTITVQDIVFKRDGEAVDNQMAMMWLKDGIEDRYAAQPADHYVHIIDADKLEAYVGEQKVEGTYYYLLDSLTTADASKTEKLTAGNHDFKLYFIANDTATYPNPIQVGKTYTMTLKQAQIQVKDNTTGITVDAREYDGTADVKADTLHISKAAFTVTVTDKNMTAVPATENIELKYTRAAYNSKDAGDRTVTLSGLSLGGTDAGNYSLLNTIGHVNYHDLVTVPAKITPKDVTITGMAVEASKTYDGKVSATSVATNAKINGKIDGDNVDIAVGNAKATYADKNVGTGKTVTFSGFSLTGTDAGNYNLTAQPADTTAAITARALKITNFTVKDKVYDGNNIAEIVSIETDAVEGDDVKCSNAIARFVASGTFSASDAQDGKLVRLEFPQGVILDGADKNNYTFDVADLPNNVTANIAKANLTGAPTFTKITQSGKTLNDLKVSDIDLSGIHGVKIGDAYDAIDLTFGWDEADTTTIQANKSYSWTVTASYPAPRDEVKNYNVLTGSVVLYPVSTGYSDQVKKQIEEFEAKKRGELPEEDTTFRDVSEDDYFFDAVNWAAENGITGGVSANRFGPTQDCSRGQTMTFLWRAMGEPEPASRASDLTDVMTGSYYYDAVLWAMEAGITTGAGANRFAPDATVTRGQFVTFLYRLANASSDGVHPFTDVPAGSYYEKAIAWAYAEGITKGTGATTFSPDAPCTRAQIITFLYRYFNR